jgi:hypothetical protein
MLADPNADLHSGLRLVRFLARQASVFWTSGMASLQSLKAS